MAFNSRYFTRSRVELPEGSSIVPLPLRKVLRTIFWSPLLLLTAIVHVLCQPLTKRCLLAVAILDIPLQWGAHLEFRPALSALGTVGGYDVSITTLALFGLYIGWLFTECANNQSPRILWNWPIAAYTAVVAASILVASDPQLSLFYVFLLVQILLLYIYLAGNINSRSDIVFILALILAGGLFESIYMLGLAVMGGKLGLVPMPGTQTVIYSLLGLKTVIFLPAKDVPFYRQGGTTGGPNYTAAYLGILITLALCVRRMKVPAYLRRLTIPTIVLALLALAITFSRGGWIEIVLSVAILAGARSLRNGISRKAALSLVAATTLVVLCLYIPNPVSKRIFSDDNGSAESRVPLMHLADHMIVANPILGVGANNFAAVMNNYEGNVFRYAWIYTVHNQFLLVCSETGIIGLAAYLWIYFNILRRGWRLWNTGDELFAPLGLAIVAGICGLMSHMLMDIFSERALLQLLWVFAALIAACEMIRRIELAEQAATQTIEARLP
ncbi:MAG: O-antigen ligase family protein [Silvibacterium sp.]